MATVAAGVGDHHRTTGSRGAQFGERGGGQEMLEPVTPADLGEEVIELPRQAYPVLHSTVLRSTQLIDQVTGAS
ncbi:MAG: hypothetical protein ACRDRO_16330 [Pseudonocardiaceae bacterium]